MYYCYGPHNLNPHHTYFGKDTVYLSCLAKIWFTYLVRVIGPQMAHLHTYEARSRYSWLRPGSRGYGGCCFRGAGVYITGGGPIICPIGCGPSIYISCGYFEKGSLPRSLSFFRLCRKVCSTDLTASSILFTLISSVASSSTFWYVLATGHPYLDWSTIWITLLLFYSSGTFQQLLFGTLQKGGLCWEYVLDFVQHLQCLLDGIAKRVFEKELLLISFSARLVLWGSPIFLGH